MKKIVKIVLIFEILSFAFENSVAAIEFSNLVMFDALKRFDFSFVDLNKRQILSSFVVFFSFFSSKRNIVSNCVFVSRVDSHSQKFRTIQKKMHSKVSDLAKKIIKITTNVTQLSIVFDDLKKAMKMLKNRLLTMKKLIRSEKMMILFSKINSERKAFVFFAEIADEKIITIESDHENQKDKFF